MALDDGNAGQADRRFVGIVHQALMADRWDVRIRGSSLAFVYVAEGRLAAAVNCDGGTLSPGAVVDPIAAKHARALHQLGDCLGVIRLRGSLADPLRQELDDEDAEQEKREMRSVEEDRGCIMR